MLENIVVVDFDPEKIKNRCEWDKLICGLEETTKLKWHLYGKQISDESFHSKERYIHYFKLGIQMFLHRKDISNIVSNQQFYGIIYAFLCSIFHVKKVNKNIIVSFIYNEKKGKVGRIYNYFIKRAVNSKYVDRLLVHSESEIKYYSDLLGIKKDKLVFCPLGITDDSFMYDITEEHELKNSYILGVGNSNRDFKFVKESLGGESYKVHIFSDGEEEADYQNIRIKKGIGVEGYYNQLAKCFCSVIPIENPDFSSGQLVMLQSYAFFKPVIITKSNVNDIYIGDGNAIVINKEQQELKKAIDYLQDNQNYQKLTEKAHKFFVDNFSMYAMGKNMGEIMKGIQ